LPTTTDERLLLLAQEPVVLFAVFRAEMLDVSSPPLVFFLEYFIADDFFCVPAGSPPLACSAVSAAVAITSE